MTGWQQLFDRSRRPLIDPKGREGGSSARADEAWVVATDPVIMGRLGGSRITKLKPWLRRGDSARRYRVEQPVAVEAESAGVIAAMPGRKAEPRDTGITVQPKMSAAKRSSMTAVTQEAALLAAAALSQPLAPQSWLTVSRNPDSMRFAR